MGVLSNKRKLLSLLLIAFMLVATVFWYIDTFVFAQEDTKYSKGRITETEGACVRRGPSTSTAKLKVVSKGQTFEVYEEKYTKNSNDKENIWLKTSLDGYVRSDLADIDYKEKDATVNVYLNARKGPSTSFPAEFVYSPQDKVSVVSKISNAGNETWYKIKKSNQSYVFVLAKYIDLQNDAYINSNSSSSQSDKYLFKTESAVKGDGSKITTYDNCSFSSNQKAPIVSRGNIYFEAEYFVSSYNASMEYRWYQTNDGRFVNGKYLTVMNYISGKGKILKDTEGLAGAGSGFKKISDLKKGAVFTAVANAYDKDGNAWLKIYENGRYKYVRSDYVSDIYGNTKEISPNNNVKKPQDDLNVGNTDKSNNAADNKQAEELKKAEDLRKAEEAKKAEALRKAEEAKKAETLRKAEEAKKAEESMKSEESQNTKPSGSLASQSSASGRIHDGYTVNVRKGPSTSNSKVCAPVTNVSLEILSETFTSNSSNKDKDIWFKTSLGGFIRSDLVDASYRTYTGYTTEYLNVRTGAGTSFPVVRVIPKDSRVNVVLKSYDRDGNLWYKIQDGNKFCYIYANYVSDTLGGQPGSNSAEENSDNTQNPSAGNDTSILRPLSSVEFENSMNEQGFPESYKPALRKLHAKYPNWQFAARHVNLDWNQALNKQIRSSNLVHSSHPEGYKDVGPDSYNFERGYYYAKDGSTFFKASPETVAYYMDPRNFINDSGIFMFEDLHYNAKFQTRQVVRDILNSTAMPAGAERYFVEAGSTYNISPVYMACKVVSEIGRSSSNIDGHSFTYGGTSYSGAYNPFNIGASDSAYGNPAAKGLAWALSGRSYLRPWNTLEKSIKGGAMFISNSFIANNQHSMYYERFNVNNGYSAVGTHQYMTAIYGAATQASQQFAGYRNLGLLNKGFVFEIPVYKNMPSTLSSAPPRGHNNAFLKSLSVYNGNSKVGFDKKFNSFQDSYYTTGSIRGASQVSINAIPYRNDVRVTYNGGPGNKIFLKNGNNVVNIDVTSPSGKTVRYKIIINK